MQYSPPSCRISEAICNHWVYDIDVSRFKELKLGNNRTFEVDNDMLLIETRIGPKNKFNNMYNWCWKTG